MKFLEPLRKIHDEVILKRGKPMLLRFLSIATLSLSFFLYGTDNMVWFANMGIIEAKSRFVGSQFLPALEWWRLKDIVALWKNLIELLKYLFDALRNYKRQLYINSLMDSMEDELIHKSSNASQQPSSFDLLKELISLRSKLRFIYLGTVQNLLRVAMLAHRLQYPLAYNCIHPIVVCVCGILSNFIAIMKLFREKKQVMQFRKVSKKEQ